MLGEVLNVNTSLVGLADFQATLWFHFRVLLKQILDLLIINFKHGELHLIAHGFILVVLDAPENLITSLWNDTFIGSITDHRVTLTRSGLAVGKQAAVVTGPSVI